MGLSGLVDDALAAVGSVIPHAGFGGFLLQEGLAFGGGDVVLVDHGAAGVTVGVEEELVVLSSDLTHGAAAAVGNSAVNRQTQPGGVGEVRAFGDAAVDLADAGGSVGLLVHVQGHGGGEAAHGVTGHADDAVAGFVLEDVGLLIHPGGSIVQGGGPEVQEGTGVLRVAGRMAVIVHIQRHDHVAAAGQFDGVQVLHLAGVEVTVGHHDGGTGVAFGSALGHVEQTAQGALFRVKVDAAHIHGVHGSVEGLSQHAARKHEHERQDQKQLGNLLLHLRNLLFLFLFQLRKLL